MLCQSVHRSEAAPVLHFGRPWPLSGHWDTRKSREQLVHSKQTAALQETLSMSSQPGSSASTNTWKTLRSGSLPHLLLFFIEFVFSLVSLGCLLGLEFVNRIKEADKADWRITLVKLFLCFQHSKEVVHANLYSSANPKLICDCDRFLPVSGILAP